MVLGFVYNYNSDNKCNDAYVPELLCIMLHIELICASMYFKVLIRQVY